MFYFLHILSRENSYIFSTFSSQLSIIVQKTTKENSMNVYRRKFMQYMSILGFVGLSGVSLQAQSVNSVEDLTEVEGYNDHLFDPDGWL